MGVHNAQRGTLVTVVGDVVAGEHRQRLVSADGADNIGIHAAPEHIPDCRAPEVLASIGHLCAGADGTLNAAEIGAGTAIEQLVGRGNRL